MNRFAGLSFLCLMFLSTYADPEISGSSWSLKMSQNNGEPIQVQSERKEYDKTGVTLHRRTKGIIENGVYKPIDEQDLRNSHQRRPRNIDALLKIADQYETRDFQKNRSKVKHYPRRFPRFTDVDDLPLMNHHPRRYGKNFRKNEKKPRGFFGFENVESFPQVQQHPIGYRHVERHHPSEIILREQSNSGFDGSVSDNVKNRLKNRSKVSFYRPVERMFEKIFGTKKKNFETENEFERNTKMQKSPRFRQPMSSPKQIHRGKDRWDENVEIQHEDSIEELLKSMQEFEDSFIFNERVEE